MASFFGGDRGSGAGAAAGRRGSIFWAVRHLLSHFLLSEKGRSSPGTSWKSSASLSHEKEGKNKHFGSEERQAAIFLTVGWAGAEAEEWG